MDAVEEVKSRIAIEDVIGEYVELKRAGRNFKGLSPFGAEKTPSFMVSPEKQIWHDFSSGKGGSVFNFIMEMEGLDFKGALELLARKAGVNLAQYRGANYAKNAQTKERLYQALDLAAKFYQEHLKRTPDALDYVIKKRGLSKETLLDFKIGYSPESGFALGDFLRGKGFTPDEIKKAGLGNIFSGRLRDMFRGRIMIALMDSSGRVVGFTARLLKDDPKAPKYINTPATLLYDKSRHVFGLHAAKESIRRNDFAVVVEGNMDVIASYQAGIKNVVATAGTAMTKDHLKEISRFSNDVRLSFDQDKAGLNATERTIILAAQTDIKLGVITIPSGKDPDELIQTDKKLWQGAIKKPQYALDWLLDRYTEGIDITTGQGKKAYANKVMPVLDVLPNAVEQEHYKKLVSERLGVSLEAVNNQAKTVIAKAPLKKPKTAVQIQKIDADIARTENQYLSLLLMQPSLRAYMDPVVPVMLHGDATKQMYDAIKEYRKDKARDVLEAVKEVDLLTDYGKVITLLYEELYAHLEFVELEYEAARLQVRVIEHFVKDQKAKITAKLHAQQDEAAVTELLQKAKKLDQLLKSVKENIRGK
jgi:DNA primase